MEGVNQIYEQANIQDSSIKREVNEKANQDLLDFIFCERNGAGPHI
jgi:hypothetical protein